MQLILAFLCLALGPVFAHELKRPASFETSFGRAVFVDFTSAHYEISYDAEKKSAHVFVDMHFLMPEEGLPIFDSVQTPEFIELDGERVTDVVFPTPAGETLVRIIEKTLPPGSHRMKLKVPLKELLSFTVLGVRSAFWTSDLDERHFLERYLPANFEYDQVKMTFEVKFPGAKYAQKIYTNGEVQALGPNHFFISYPEYFTASSIFFHTVPEGATSELTFGFTSRDGRYIPGVVYLRAKDLKE